MTISDREKEYYDKFWEVTRPEKIEGTLNIPGISSLLNTRVLICSCGSGWQPIQAANGGAEVYAFDISEKAVENALAMAAYNKVTINAEVMDFHSLKYPDNYFDIIYGTMILHHIDCSAVSREIYRCLKPGGMAYFKENSDRNPILRFFRRALFGKPGELQKRKFLFFERGGSNDEYPLTDAEIYEFRKIFGKQHVKLFFPDFVFFALLYRFGMKKEIVLKITQFLDEIVSAAFPFLQKYSFLQELQMEKT